MPTPISVLLVEDSEPDAILLQRELRRHGYDPSVRRVVNLTDLRETLEQSTWDIILSDYNLNDFNGLDALKVVKETGQDLPFILISGAVGEEIAVEAMKAGAQDYIKKDNLSRLVPAIQRELREAQIRRERRQVSALLSESEARYKSLVENLPVGVFRTTPTPSGNFLMANSTLLSMLGFASLDQLLQLTFDDIFQNPHDSQTLVKDLLDQGSLTALEVELKRGDGSRLWGSVNAKIGYDASGEPAYFNCILEDITVRKQSEKIKQALYDISQAANTSSDLTDFMQTIHQIIGSLMPATNFHLAIYNENSDTITFPYFIDQYTAPGPKAMDQSLTAYVIRSGKPLLVTPDTLAELEASGEIEPIQTPLVDWMGVPLRTADQRTIGALVVQIYETSYQYTLHDLEVLNFVSSQAGMAIERKRAEELLEEQRLYLRQVIDTSPNLIFAKDQWGRFTLANQAVANTYGTSVDDLIGQTDADYNTNPNEVTLFRLDDTEVIRSLQEKFIREEKITDYRGQAHYLQTTKRPLIHPGTGEIQVLGVSTDISERKIAEEQLLHNALHDSLTQLPNRTLFLDRVSRAMERARRHQGAFFAMLLIGLDRFGIINDSLGHEFGDNLLIMVSGRLEVCIESSDTLARIGGDEFGILLEDLESVDQVTQISERLLKEVSMPLFLEGQELIITTSIGIVISSSEYEQPEAILRDADIALQRAKALGRGRFAVFSNAMRETVLAQLELAKDLRQALERQELVLHFQPIARMHNGELHGFEALVYWEHPRRGLVSPAEFISFAEETGLILPLGNWVLNEACRQLKDWQIRFPYLSQLSISVNISSKQFSQVDLVDQVKLALHQANLAPHCLRLEITESVIMEHHESVIEALNTLRLMGVSVDIDDFGTGYSSLVYLHRLPINAIKIDRSFISGSLERTNGLEISRTIVRLAMALKMETIAEGVETEEQLHRMRMLGCNYIQGNLLATAMPTEVAEQYLVRWSQKIEEQVPLDRNIVL
jgi:diguanylate cyclase (GGDEF)-like protein/PAS domain S-box-containing protein